MPDPSPRGIYWGDDAWFRKHDFAWFPDSYFRRRTWQSAELAPYHCLKLISKINERVSIHPGSCEPVGQASAVYNAEILKNNQQKGNPVIVKIFMRIPNIRPKPGRDHVDTSDLLSQKRPIVEIDNDTFWNESSDYERESQMLAYLTGKECSSTPKHIASFTQNEILEEKIADFQHNGANPWVQDGFLCFVVMTKVPGITVSEIWSFDPTPAQRNEQNRIQQKFKIALLELARLQVTLTDKATRNIMWDRTESKCYLVDFENSWYESTPKPTTWEGLTKHLSHPDRLLQEWGLETRELRKRLAK